MKIISKCVEDYIKNGNILKHYLLHMVYNKKTILHKIHYYIYITLAVGQQEPFEKGLPPSKSTSVNAGSAGTLCDGASWTHHLATLTQ